MLCLVMQEKQKVAQKPQPQLRLIIMPKLTYMGQVFPKDKAPHPQQPALGDVFRVSGMTPEDNGVYVIPIRDNYVTKVTRIIGSAAEKLTGRLPQKDSLFPIYGRDEIKTVPHPIKERTSLARLIHNSLHKDRPDTTIRFE